MVGEKKPLLTAEGTSFLKLVGLKKLHWITNTMRLSRSHYDLNMLLLLSLFFALVVVLNVVRVNYS